MPESQQRNRTSHTSGIVLETYIRIYNYIYIYILIVHFLRGVRPMFKKGKPTHVSSLLTTIFLASVRGASKMCRVAAAEDFKDGPC